MSVQYQTDGSIIQTNCQDANIRICPQSDNNIRRIEY